MRIAISGADGFLGTHILDELKNTDGHEIAGITLRSEYLEGRYRSWKNLTIIPADIKAMEESDSLKNVDVFIACAFPRTAQPSRMAEGLDFVFKSTSLLMRLGCKFIINISSQSVYDSYRKKPAVENDTVMLGDTYAVAKYCVEQYIEQICYAYNSKYVNVRMASLIGPSFEQRLPNKLINKALRGEGLSIDDFGYTFGYLDVRDAANILVLLLDNIQFVDCNTLNIGPSHSVTIRQIAESIVAAFRRKGFQIGEVKIEHRSSCNNSINTSLDVSRLTEILNQLPMHSLDESIEAILDASISELGISQNVLGLQTSAMNKNADNVTDANISERKACD